MGANRYLPDRQVRHYGVVHRAVRADRRAVPDERAPLAVRHVLHDRPTGLGDRAANTVVGPPDGVTARHPLRLHVTRQWPSGARVSRDTQHEAARYYRGGGEYRQERQEGWRRRASRQRWERCGPGDGQGLGVRSHQEDVGYKSTVARFHDEHLGQTL